jgi:hypothetical protein
VNIKIFRRAAVEAAVGLSRSTIYAMMAAGEFPRVASRHCSGLERVQYPMPVKKPGLLLLVFTQVNPTVQYLKPQAVISSNALGSIGSVTHRRRVQLSAARFATGSAAIDFKSMQS